MKQQSLLSQRSNLSHLSNVSYHGEKRQYIGSQFFRESLPPGQNPKFMCAELKQEEIELESLKVGVFRHFNPTGECISAFTPYWTCLNQSVEGTSDNQNEPELQLPAKQPEVKIEEVKQEPEDSISQPSQSLQQPESVSNKKLQSSSQKNERSIKNETKNIPKNYGKAIIIFIENNKEMLQPLLANQGNDYDQLIIKLRNLKKKINTISDLRNLWQNHPESKCLRIISNNFLRKHSLHYIYNSRIKTRLCHAKYKRRLQEAILNPQEFNHIKDY